MQGLLVTKDNQYFRGDVSPGELFTGVRMTKPIRTELFQDVRYFEKERQLVNALDGTYYSQVSIPTTNVSVIYYLCDKDGLFL